MLYEPKNCPDKAAASGRSAGPASDRPWLAGHFILCPGKLQSMERAWEWAPLIFIAASLLDSLRELDWFCDGFRVRRPIPIPYCALGKSLHRFLGISLIKWGLSQWLLTLKPYTWKSSVICMCHASYFVIIGVVFSLTIELLFYQVDFCLLFSLRLW